MGQPFASLPATLVSKQAMTTQKRPRLCVDSTDRLRDLLHHSTKSGLAEILRIMRRPDEETRGLKALTTIERSIAQSTLQRRSYETDRGTIFDWPFACPALLLARLVQCPGLSRVWDCALREYPPSRHCWRLMLAYDEFSPGNKLKCDNRRKTMVLSFTFLELSPLRESRKWITFAVVRHDIIRIVPGGWSSLLADALEHILLGPSGLTTAGIAMTVAGQDVCLRGRLHAILSDGDGLKCGFDWKGATSLKPCLLHWNLWK